MISLSFHFIFLLLIFLQLHKILNLYISVYKQAFGEAYADAYLREELNIGKSKFSDYDRTLIEQSINELLGEKEI